MAWQARAAHRQTRSHLHSFRQRIHQARLLRIAGRQVLLINLGAVGPVETAVGPRCLTPAPTHPARTGCEVALTCHDLDGPRLSRPASAGASILAWLRLVVGRFSLPGALFNAILCCDRRGESGKGLLERAVRVARRCRERIRNFLVQYSGRIFGLGRNTLGIHSQRVAEDIGV